MNHKPTFFISSTIHDFKDLRSSIKFYLEEQGCTVLASEYNDFGQSLDLHSYDACLDQIKAADYFILLIGARIGGWFDQANKISITRKEYRTAYGLHRQGRVKILAFVRSDIWAVKDDRKELSRFLDSLGLEPATVAAIKGRPGKATSDAEFLIDFIEEVGRNQETTSAVKGDVAFPTGNWIHAFSSFRDVIDTLRGQVFAGRPIDHAVMRQLLRAELLATICQLITKIGDGDAVFSFTLIEEFSRKYPLVSEQLNRSVRVDREDFERFFHVLLCIGRGKLQTHVLDQALMSNVFLGFDPGAGAFQETPVYGALFLLRQEIDAYARALTGSSPTSEAVKALEAAGPGRPVTLALLTLVGLRHFVDRATNVVLLAKATVRHLDGAPLVIPALRPSSPFIDQLEQLDRERVTPALAEKFVAA